MNHSDEASTVGGVDEESAAALFFFFFFFVPAVDGTGSTVVDVDGVDSLAGDA